MLQQTNILLNDLILSLSKALDLGHPDLTDHQQRVAYIALSLAQTMGWPEDEQRDLLYAGCLHDIGLLTLADKLRIRDHQVDDQDGHGQLGCKILENFGPFRRAALLIRDHHQRWAYGQGRQIKGEPVLLGSHLLRLADRIELAIKPDEYILSQKCKVCQIIAQGNDSEFMPEMVEAFREVSSRESFWLDLVSSQIYSILSRQVNWASWRISVDDLTELTSVFSRIIDFRSPWTVTHSAGVAASMEFMGQSMELSRRECRMLRVAGYLHDLGKLFVPEFILNKPEALDNRELKIMRAHTYYTFQILEPIGGLEQVNEWAAFHHERLNGQGYPFHHSEENLTLGSRIMAVADMYTAITENRPYRKAMSKDKTVKVLTEAAQNRCLDKRLVELLLDNFAELTQFRTSMQSVLPAQYGSYVKTEESAESAGRKEKEALASQPA